MQHEGPDWERESITIPKRYLPGLAAFAAAALLWWVFSGFPGCAPAKPEAPSSERCQYLAAELADVHALKSQASTPRLQRVLAGEEQKIARELTGCPTAPATEVGNAE